MIHNILALRTKEISLWWGSSVKKRSAHKNHNTAELPSEFLVSSTPSSIATGKRVIEHTPMTIKMAKSAASLCGLTVMSMAKLSELREKGSRTFSPAQIRDNQAAAMIGHRMRTASPR
jgi:hypothetical protein